ncbi:hypothetical protein BX600DRAFT_510080 [Xylariales sp. PMI_506]|nr:hypothetical protein BX600DRAFT_510080 [Xylariales sp. PMI_506]
MPPKGGPRGVKRRGPPGGKGAPTNKRRNYGPKFANSRLADVEASGSEDSDGEVDQSDVASELSEEEEDASEDEDQAASSKPYLALMQSFSKNQALQAKRRKLEDAPKSNERGVVQDSDDDQSEEGADLDLVEEPEEDPAAEAIDEAQDSDDEEPDQSDPFETHFAQPDSAEVAKRIAAAEAKNYSTTQSELNGWRLTRSVPGQDTVRSMSTLSSSSDLKLKQKLVETTAKRSSFDKLEQVLYPLTFGYNDVMFCSRTPKNAESMRRMACLHAVNHVYKTRDRVLKNNAKLSKEGEDSEFEPRDQGFTRPKVLMLLPTRQSAVNVVNTICSIVEPDQQENRKRFDDSYVDKEEKFSSDRPDDFRELFGGNDDDMFRLGVKFTRKTIKYFAQFYNSDILVASPLGLRMAIGSEENKDKKHKKDYDFLSSIEVVIVDQADALLMQNWEHVEFIFEHLNLQPREAHGCDFSRVREWYLEKQGQNYRQTLIFSAFNTPELSELHRQCQNWAGRVRVQPEYQGSIQELGIKAKQTFSRFDAKSIAAEPDARFEYFTSTIIPTLAKRAKDVSGTLIFVPSYLDFVRVRNYFATSPAAQDLTFGVISEYSSVPEASRARSHFINGRHKILLYTERAHHFRRYLFAGVQRVIMYGLPDNAIFYKEIAGGYLAKSERDLKLEPGMGTVRVLFSKYDLLKLERIVGSNRVGKMIRERGDTFDFV